MSALDKQIGGSHYKDMAIQPVEYIVKNRIPYREANIIKYVSRYASKNGLQDLEKARHYLEMLIDELSEKDALKSDKNTTVADPESDRLGPDEGWIEWEYNYSPPLPVGARFQVRGRDGSCSGIAYRFPDPCLSWGRGADVNTPITHYRVIEDK